MWISPERRGGGLPSALIFFPALANLAHRVVACSVDFLFLDNLRFSWSPLRRLVPICLVRFFDLRTLHDLYRPSTQNLPHHNKPTISPYFIPIVPCCQPILFLLRRLCLHSVEFTSFLNISFRIYITKQYLCLVCIFSP